MSPAASRVMNAEPNVTPMIDVLLVLIIVFMIANIRVRMTMDAVLPIDCAGACETAANTQIVLEVLPGPAYRVNGTLVGAGGNLLARIEQLYRGRPDKIIYVAGRPGVHYEDVIDAMDIAKAAGVRVIGIPPKDLPPTAK
jgi:biopolymer transport protein ExbD